MAPLAGAPHSLRLGRRLVEWAAFGLVLAVLLLIFLRESADVRGRAELASVQTTLAALRTAAVIRFVEAGRSGVSANVAFLPRNPFAGLVDKPPLYLGERDAATLPAQPAGWFYEPGCDCVGYRPLDPRWLGDSEGSGLLRYRIRRDAGPLQFEPMATYRWQGETLR